MAKVAMPAHRRHFQSSMSNQGYAIAPVTCVIAMSCDPSFNFSIDGHRMTNIEGDGTKAQPVGVDSIPILAGQHHSATMVVTADQLVGNY